MNTLLVLALGAAIVLMVLAAKLPSTQKEPRNASEDHSRL